MCHACSIIVWGCKKLSKKVHFSEKEEKVLRHEHATINSSNKLLLKKKVSKQLKVP